MTKSFKWNFKKIYKTSEMFSETYQLTKSRDS